MNDSNIPWVIAVPTESSPFKQTGRRWHTRYHPDIETQSAEHLDTSHLQ